MDAAKAEKERFYLELDRLHTDDAEEGVDEGRKESEDVLATGRKICQKLKDDSITTRGLPRSLSDSHVINERTGHNATPGAHSTSVIARHGPMTGLRRALTSDNVSQPLQDRSAYRGAEGRIELLPTEAPVVGNKRKRGIEPQIIPSNQRIFNNMHFFFFPNNNVHPGRRIRINKAIEFGAVWRKDWSDSITHVVTDKTIDYSLLLRYLKLEVLPSHVTLVNEDYPANCISYRCILDPNHQQYRIKSAPVLEILDKVVDQGATPTTPDGSLELKATGKRRQILSQTTSQFAESLSSPIRPINSSQANPTTAKITSSIEVPESPFCDPVDFDDIIRQARELEQLPLDDDDDESSDKGSKHRFDLPNNKKGQDAFHCMHRNTAGSGSDSPNQTTIHVLQQMADYYNTMGDEWRTRAYRKAVSALRKHPQKVCTREQARQIPQIGDRIASKIEEIAFTNRLRRLDAALAEPEDKILRTFMGIHGVGFTQASKWVAAGYKTLEELSKYADVTANQRVGIMHYDDFNSRIPRAEVENIGAVVRMNLERLNANVELIIGGSYRRGSETSGDVDCIITHPTLEPVSLRSLVFDRLVPKLTAANFFVAQLSTSSRDEGSKWLGACQLPCSSTTGEMSVNPWRRIDLLVVPRDELGAALIYFTGNDLFNRSMRLLASTKGMRLNQRGLYRDVLRSKARVKITEGSLVEGRDERKIFAALGVPWRPPEHRIC